MEEEALRKMAVKQYLRSKFPISIYHSMAPLKKWFFRWLPRYRFGETDWYQEKLKIPCSHLQKIHPDIHRLFINIWIQLEENPYSKRFLFLSLMSR